MAARTGAFRLEFFATLGLSGVVLGSCLQQHLVKLETPPRSGDYWRATSLWTSAGPPVSDTNLMINIDEKKRFAQESVRSYNDGDYVFREGEDSREMYVVKTGEVVVSKKGKRGDIELAVLRKGDFVGEMSLLESLPRSASARARGATQLLVIHPGGFLLKIRRDPTFAFEMLQTLSRRIRVTNDSLLRELNREGISLDSLQNIMTQTEFDKNEDGPRTSDAAPLQLQGKSIA